MTAEQKVELQSVAGKRFLALAKRERFNLAKPTEADIEKLKKIAEKANNDARKIKYANPAWLNLNKQ